MKRKKADPSARSHDQLITGALIGLNIIILLQLLTLTPLDRPLSISLYCLVVAIPLLAMAQMNSMQASGLEYDLDSWLFDAAQAVAGLISLIALGALFWHLSPTSGRIFLALCFAALIGVIAYGFALGTINGKKRRG